MAGEMPEGMDAGMAMETNEGEDTGNEIDDLEPGKEGREAASPPPPTVPELRQVQNSKILLQVIPGSEFEPYSDHVSYARTFASPRK